MCITIMTMIFIIHLNVSHAFSGFTPDVKVWEVLFNKEGDFSEVKRVMDLKGHRASVYYLSFNTDSTRFENYFFCLTHGFNIAALDTGQSS